MRYTWTESKRIENLRKHQIDFVDARRIWDGVVQDRYDGREDYGEDRWVAYGQLGARVLAVVYTEPDDDTTHLISAREATKDEQADYWRAYPQ